MGLWSRFDAMQNLAKTLRNLSKLNGVSQSFAAVLQGFRGKVKKQIICL
jgi:hypothetical protein